MGNQDSGVNPQAGVSNHSGDNYVYGGILDPTVTAIHAPKGALWIRVGRSASDIIGIYQKQDNGPTTNWSLLNTLFGNEFQSVEDETMSSTSSTVFISKILLTTTDLPLGNYILFYNMETPGNGGGQEREIRLFENGANEIGFINSSANNVFNMSGHKVFMGMSGINTFDLQFRRILPDADANVRRARLALWRIL